MDDRSTPPGYPTCCEASKLTTSDVAIAKLSADVVAACDQLTGPAGKFAMSSDEATAAIDDVGRHEWRSLLDAALDDALAKLRSEVAS